MIADLIRLILENMPLILFVAAIAAALLLRHPGGLATRLLAWLLFLSVGVEAVWGGVFHVFFPRTAAASIGWQVSPFQFEIGVADIAIGIVAILSFWRPSLRPAVVLYVVLFYFGLTFGHLREAFAHGDFSADNFGTLLMLTVVKLVLLPLLWLATRARL